MTRELDNAATVATPANEVSLFKFKDADVRVVSIDGEPMFFGTDACDVLLIKAKAYAYGRLGADEVRYVGRAHLGLPAGKPMALITESGLYKLVMRSDKPEAKEFQHWVTSVVLPSIRKDGGYVMGSEKLVTGEMTPDEFMARALVMADATIKRSLPAWPTSLAVPRE